MKLRYWFAESKGDHRCYSIIAKTKKEAEDRRQRNDPNEYEEPVLRVIHYRDAFDLLEQLTGEDGGRGYGFEKDDR